MSRLSHSSLERQAPLLADPSVEIQCGRLTFKNPLGGGRVGGGLRGIVKEMSKASRRRLMATFASLDWRELSRQMVPIWFVTLTTPEEYWNDELRVYLAARRFREALEAQFPDYRGAIVRKERGQRRGMLHYHPIIVGCADLSRTWLRNTWTKCLEYEGPGDRGTGFVRVDVETVESAERVTKYLSKYCAKAGYHGKISSPAASGEGGDGAGSCVAGCAAPPLDGEALSKAHNVDGTYTGTRWWYIWGRENLPWADVDVLNVPDPRKLAYSLKRIFRRWRLDKVRQGLAKQSGGLLRRIVEGYSNRQIAKMDLYGEHLRRSCSGFTFLAGPDLIEQLVEAAIGVCIANTLDKQDTKCYG